MRKRSYQNEIIVIIHTVNTLFQKGQFWKNTPENMVKIFNFLAPMLTKTFVFRKLKKEREWREAINKLSVDSLTVKDGSIEELKDVVKSAVSRFESKVDSSLLQLKMCFQPEGKCLVTRC